MSTRSYYNCPNHADPVIKCRYQIPFRSGKLNYCPNCDAGPLWICPKCGELTDLSKHSCPNGHDNTGIDLPEAVRKQLPERAAPAEPVPAAAKAPRIRKSQSGHFAPTSERARAGFLPRFRALLGDTYRAAALAGADVRPVADFLESVRDTFRENNDALAARASLDSLIGANSNPKLEPIYQQLRRDAVALLQEYWLAELHDARSRSEDEAWSLFVNRFAEALTRWRTRLCIWWSDTAAGEQLFSKKHAQRIETYRHHARLMEQGRWVEVLPFLDTELAGNERLHDKTRAFILAACGSVRLYNIDAEDATSWLDRAEAVHATLPYLQLMRAEQERVRGNTEAARTRAEQYLEQWPNDPEAWVSLGQGYFTEKNLPKALECYQQALQADPGTVSAYQYVFSVWASDPELFARHQAEIPGLLERAIEIEPEADITLLQSTGYSLEAAGEWETARNWFRKALEKDPDSPETLTALGNTFKSEALRSDPPPADLLQQARAWYDKALDRAPGFVNGYWLHAMLEAELNEPLNAARWFEKAIPNCPAFHRTLLIKAGEMYLAAGDTEKAIARGLEALRLDPAFGYAQNHLHTVVDRIRDRSWEEKTGPAAAIDLLNTLRGILGDAYEANYRNRLGNVYYYFEDYETAVQAYQAAIAAEPQVAVYHDNLAGALSRLDRIEAAWKAAEEAFRLDPFDKDYRKRASELERQARALRHFGVAPGARSAQVDPIKIRFTESVSPWFVAENALRPELLEKIAAFREDFQKRMGVPYPGIRFTDDHTPRYEFDNFSIELDGVAISSDYLQPGGYFVLGADAEQLEKAGIESVEHPNVPGIRWLDPAHAANVADGAIRHGDYLDFALILLESALLNNADLSDFIHYDSGVLSERFVGESADFAAQYLQFNRMATKYRLSVLQEKETLFDVFKRCYDKGWNLQQMIVELFNVPSVLYDLPVNRALRAGDCTIVDAEPWIEEAIRQQTVLTEKGYHIWEVADATEGTAFASILDVSPNGKTRFIRTSSAVVATVLNDILPGSTCLDAWILPPENAEPQSAGKP